MVNTFIKYTEDGSVLVGDFLGTISFTTLSVADLTVTNSFTTVDVSSSGAILVDADLGEALLVRKDGDAGDVFKVDTSNERVGINTSGAPAAVLEIDATSSSVQGLFIDKTGSNQCILARHNSNGLGFWFRGGGQTNQDVFEISAENLSSSGKAFLIDMQETDYTSAHGAYIEQSLSNIGANWTGGSLLTVDQNLTHSQATTRTINTHEMAVFSKTLTTTNASASLTDNSTIVDVALNLTQTSGTLEYNGVMLNVQPTDGSADYYGVDAKIANFSWSIAGGSNTRDAVTVQHVVNSGTQSASSNALSISTVYSGSSVHSGTFVAQTSANPISSALAWQSSGNLTDGSGGQRVFSRSGTGSTTQAFGGADVYFLASNSGTDTLGAGQVSSLVYGGTATQTSNALWTGSIIDATGGNTNITNLYGMLVPDIALGSNNWAIKTGTGLVELGDNLTVDKGGLVNTNVNINGSTHFTLRATATDTFELRDSTADAARMTVDSSGNFTFAQAVEIDGAFNHDGSTFGALGATPAAQQTHVADPSGGGTQDAEARTAINAILTTLETFGFHASS